MAISEACETIITIGTVVGGLLIADREFMRRALVDLRDQLAKTQRELIDTSRRREEVLATKVRDLEDALIKALEHREREHRQP